MIFGVLDDFINSKKWKRGLTIILTVADPKAPISSIRVIELGSSTADINI